MDKITAGRLFARALKNEGVECVFSLSGGHIMPIYYGCREEGIKIIDTRHEAAAAHAADAYARITGKPGVVITTAGPGVTNTTTAMIEARQSGSPVLHIGGAAPIKEDATGTLQDVNSVEIMGTVCKWSQKIYHGYRVPEYVSIAFRKIMEGTPGPVYLEISSDVVQERYDESSIYYPEKYRTDLTSYGNPKLIREAAHMLFNAKKPLLVIGDEARFCCCDDGAVKELVKLLDMPVWTVNIARGAFSDEDEPLFKMGFGATNEADVILELGVRNDFMVGKGRTPTFHKDAKFIQVNSDYSRIGYNVSAEIGILGAVDNVAKELLLAVQKLKPHNISNNWYEEAKGLNEIAMKRYTDARNSDILPMHPGRAAAEVAKFLNIFGRDWSIVCDGGDTTHWIKNNILAHVPGQIVEKGPFGTIGSGAGFVTGAWAARNKPVLYYTGDGSFGFHSMEFDTYVRHKIPVVCIIANDSAWGMIRMAEEDRNPEEIKKGAIGLLLEERRYDLMPLMWGGKGVYVTKPEEIIPAIKEIYDSGLPGIINISIDKNGKSHVTESYGKGLKV